MRTPRKLRPFRPSALSLESICPVSSFATALPLTTSANATEVGTRPTRPEQPPHVEWAVKSNDPTRITPTQVVTTPGAAVSTAKLTVAIPTAVTLSVNQGTGSETSVDVGRYENTITIAGANTASARPSSMPAQAQDTGGSGGVIQASSATSPPTDGTVAISAAATASSSSIPVAPVSPADLLSKIRPMTLAASQQATSPSAMSGNGVEVAQGSSPSGASLTAQPSMSGSGGGANMTPPPLFSSGGGDGPVLVNPNQPGAYKMAPNPLPVGMIFYVDLRYATGVQSAQWSGGTSYSGYNPGDPNAAATSPVTLTKNVVSNNSFSYTFILDATPRNYTVSVTVQYQGGGSGTSTLTFTTIKPPVTYNVVQTGTVNGTYTNYVTNVQGQQVPTAYVVGELNSGTATLIRAQTGPSGSSYLNGQFAWFQKINATATITNAPNAVTHTRQTAGLVIDDGYDGTRAPLGQPITEGGKIWPLNSTQITRGTFTDGPSLLDVSPQGNNAPLYDKSISYNANFETYLMYAPPGGVWIALQEFTWNFQVSATNTLYGANNFPNYNWVVNPPVQPSPTGSTPSDDAAFPTWTGESFGTAWNPPS